MLEFPRPSNRKVSNHKFLLLLNDRKAKGNCRNQYFYWVMSPDI